MIKDYWVYQKCDVPVPWALYIVKEYERGKRKVGEVEFDVTVYHDGIDNDLHAKSFVGIKANTVSSLVSLFESKIKTATGDTILPEDHEQLTNSLLDILAD